MFEVTLEENERLWEELTNLRQAIMRAEPQVILDGRFERMIITPISVISIARELIAQIPELRQASVL